jgi:hypothetical protein
MTGNDGFWWYTLTSGLQKSRTRQPNKKPQPFPAAAAVRKLYLLAATRPGVVAVAVFLPNLPIFVVDYKFGFLIAADLTRNIYSFLLGVRVFDGSLASAHFDVPTTALRWHYMM